MGDKDQESEVEEADEEAKVDKAPPTVVPVDEDTTSGRRHRKWLVAVIIAVVVVVVAGLAGWRVVENRRHGSALESCNRAAKSLQERTSSAKMARYREASGVKADQVKDAKTVTNMSRSVKAAGGLKPSLIQCNASMSTGELNATAGQAGKIDGKYAAVARAAKAVIASRDAKTLDDAKAALNTKKDEASKLLGDSDGKVADNATRDNLQTAINQAGQVKGDEAKAYQDAAGSLQAAIDRVNASVQAKSQADQQAAAQAQAQAAQQQAQRQGATQRRQASSSNGRRGSTQSRRPSYRPSGNRGGGGGGSAPSVPQGGGEDNSWIDELKNQKPIGNHGCNSAGVCVLG
ncbi:hypothetical protein [Bifidobacterium asteroides]|uniref:Colicin transporter n=1 Tax=Bifidobacterium asteroides TaxID=1684 RepID=A0A6N7TXG7_9BIFI|nr:hypothetical protein [Bifidobacterium asteroides]MSD91083.1 hypothetical protein [Bifidobacterium asteroides]